MTLHKLCNSSGDIVNDMLEGVVALNPCASMLHGLDQGIKVVCNTQHDPSHVAIVSGGGSGHEPATAGFVGPGLLAAAVCGDVFASPTSRAVYEAILSVAGPAGCLVIVLNYTGDRLNFGMAVEMARADGVLVELMFVADDCGVQVPGISGARGIAGAALVQKVAGAAAAAGRSLEEVRKAAGSAAASVSSMGVALSSCSLPGATEPPKGPGVGEIELGLGIHGEPGAERRKEMSARDTVAHLLERVCKAVHRRPGSSRADSEQGLQPGDRVVLMVNNLGGMTTMEVMVVTRDALQWLSEKGFEVDRALVGVFISSLDMSGVSLSVMHVDDTTLELLDAPTSAPAWPRSIPKPQLGKALQPLSSRSRMAAEHDTATAADDGAAGQLSPAGSLLKKVLEACAKACIDAEPELTRQDEAAGDADCGHTMKRGGEALLAVVDTLPCDLYGETARRLAVVLGEHMGGTSGALYNIFLAAAAAVAKGASTGDAAVADWVAALEAALDAVKRYGRAGVGDRTMVDALQPAAEAARAAAAGPADAVAVARAAADAAKSGAAGTAQLKGRGGRAASVNPDLLLGMPDPGAHAVAQWMAAIHTELAQS